MARIPPHGLAGPIAVLALAACAGAAPRPEGAAAAPDWPGSRWTVLAMADAEGVLVGLPAGVAIDLAFDADAARVAGSAGCNRYSAAAKVDGSRITFGPAAASKRLCGAPEGVMALEARFLRTLDAVSASTFEDSRLELRGADGMPLLALVRAAPD